MRLDWNVPVWQVLAMVWVVFLFFFGVMRKLDKLISIFEEYPPHKHVFGKVMYPKGMKPNGD